MAAISVEAGAGARRVWRSGENGRTEGTLSGVPDALAPEFQKANPDE